MPVTASIYTFGLDHAIYRLSDRAELVERRPEKAPLRGAADGRDHNDKASMQQLCRIELPEIARVVGDEDKIAHAGVADDVPVFPAGAGHMREVLGFIAGLPGDSDQVDADALVDQKPHDIAMASRWFQLLRRNMAGVYSLSNSTPSHVSLLIKVKTWRLLRQSLHNKKPKPAQHLD
jgi:hypothetical protein